jgi:homoserine trans-succinylase
LLGATPLQVELTLVRMTDHVARNTPPRAHGGVLSTLGRHTGRAL